MKNSETFKLIDSTIAINDIDLIIVEGVNYNLGINPKIGVFGENEMTFAINMARKHRIDYCGVEPNDVKLYNTLLKMKFTKNEIFLLEVLRQYKIFARDNLGENNFYDDISNNIIPYLHKKINLNLSSNFFKIFKKTFGVDFIYGITDLEIAAPDKYGKFITNKMAELVGLIRDTYIIKYLYKYINTHKKILVIYGQNHLWAHLVDTFKNFTISKYTLH